MNKLYNKDFSIAFKTGSEANKLKFKKEAVQGELYFAIDSQTLYVAETTAGAIDATLSKFSATSPNPPFNIDEDTEANIQASTPTLSAGEVGIRYGTDTENFYIFDGTYWYTFNHDAP